MYIYIYICGVVVYVACVTRGLVLRKTSFVKTQLQRCSPLSVLDHRISGWLSLILIALAPYNVFVVCGVQTV